MVTDLVWRSIFLYGLAKLMKALSGFLESLCIFEEDLGSRVPSLKEMLRSDLLIRLCYLSFSLSELNLGLNPYLRKLGICLYSCLLFRFSPCEMG